MLLSKGYHETTIDDIVAESGLTKGGIYWYFKSKRDIFLSLLDRHIREESATWSNMARGHLSFEQILEQLVPDSFNIHLHDRILVPLFNEMAAEATRDKTLKRKLHSLVKEGITATAASLEEAHTLGKIKKPDYQNFAMALCAFGYGLLLLYDISDRTLPVEEIWRDFGGWLLHGIKKGKKP